MRRRLPISLFALLLIFVFAASSQAQVTKYWIKNNNSAPWFDNSTWSLTSGGTTTTTVPGPLDSAVFDQFNPNSEVWWDSFTGNRTNVNASFKNGIWAFIKKDAGTHTYTLTNSFNVTDYAWLDMGQTGAANGINLVTFSMDVNTRGRLRFSVPATVRSAT